MIPIPQPLLSRLATAIPLLRRTPLYFCLISLICLGVACSPHKHDDHDHSHNHEHGSQDDHAHGDSSPSGGSFKPGKGVLLTDETAKLIGLSLTEVTEKEIPHLIPILLQVFVEHHDHPESPTNHGQCTAHGSGFVTTNQAPLIQPGLPIHWLPTPNSQTGGHVTKITLAPALGEFEVIATLTNFVDTLKSGTFTNAHIALPTRPAVTAIPDSALLRTAEGSFAYTLNGDAYFRTPVKTGAENDGWIEITDGLLTGDQVVTHPVETLWLIELRATKGGGHSH